MNRQQRRNLLKQAGKTKKRPKQSAATSAAVSGMGGEQPQKIIDNLPVPQIVAGINNLLSQLQSRGLEVADWDDHGRQLYRLQMRRGKIYYLAAGEEIKPLLPKAPKAED